MPSQPPEGEPAPSDGSLPTDALASFGTRPFAFYVHVPFCSTRCGYCDFNTYTSDELGPGASRASYADQVVAEVRLARRVLGDRDVPVSSVFVGGGTPTLLPAGDLGRILAAVRAEFGLTADAEVTTEANPDSVTAESLAALRADGFTRVSFGMQSSAPHVLAVLERTHTPGRAVAAVAEARAAGFPHVNVDLIYAAPGETEADFAASLAAAVGSGADHVSAYALIVEDGTRLAARIRRGELPDVDDDVAADRYLQADAALGAAGLAWYEVSNWARPGGECRHNLAYWRGDDWWGAGPGAHSHVGGVRWWNVRHPAAYAARIAAGESPAQAREVLTAEDRRVEDVLLRVRLREGLPLGRLTPAGLAVAERAVADGLAEGPAYAAGRLVLTLRGRLLADALVRDLVD
ncbi:MAG: radical SAM family heme chaperone HemW [Actinomycetales bacterium]|nr:radical SAM family heme chaperone HemW [Actinomycetales bacterium]